MISDVKKACLYKPVKIRTGSALDQKRSGTVQNNIKGVLEIMKSIPWKFIEELCESKLDRVSKNSK